VDKIDRRAGAIIFACGVNGGRVAKTPAIFCVGLRLYEIGHHGSNEQLEHHIDVVADERLWKGRRLDEEEPVEVGGGKLPVRVLYM